MAANLSGTLNVFRALVQPRLIVPDLSVKSIRAVDWRALRQAGYVGAVFDKDNCLTRPYDDKLVPELKDSWEECKEVFGRDNVLIVSNSAGTKSDAGLIQAESVSHHLGVPVLAHTTKKPGCIKPILRYFSERHPPPPALSSPPPHARTSPTKLSILFTRFCSPPQHHPKIIVVGDRLFTDVLMANRIGPSALAIWTTGLWVRESMFLRRLEKLFLDSVLRYRKYCRQRIAKASEEVEPPADPSVELAKRFIRRPRTHHGLQLTQSVPVVPRAWYTRYVLAVLGSSWRGVRWLFVRLTEGRAAREARSAKKQDVDRILQGDAEHASRPGIVKRLIAWTKALRQSPRSAAKPQEAPAEEMKSSMAEPPSMPAPQQRVQT
ncbi:hypothetical protein M407DRAFT_82679 [Tulasnella calospora MUT 4182]|uniref:Uncharacterized protein n=1 Tax=Tulasnella calospora MUT 4182 TaxID=1051891 RepID=A0A0C3Q6P9_9AGAM|nr:hypothetical protein M407DRAFT_82679 [Tulasnella calospora MUT 4182]